MFGKYNINDLFIASIDVTYPITDWEINAGGLLIADAGYGYLTIVRKNGNKFIDLQNPSRKLTKTSNPRIIGYKIDYMEPLSKYYTQEGKKKATFSKRQALNTAKQHYDEFHTNHLNRIEEEQKSKSL